MANEPSLAGCGLMSWLLFHQPLRGDGLSGPTCTGEPGHGRQTSERVSRDFLMPGTHRWWQVEKGKNVSEATDCRSRAWIPGRQWCTPPGTDGYLARYFFNPSGI